MDELQAARAEIDAVDGEMAKLFCRRMDAVRAVAAYKRDRGMEVLDASREDAVVRSNLAKLPDEAYAGYYEDFIRHLMGLSRAMQRALLGRDAVAYQGAEGAFSFIALRRLFPHGRALGYATWDEVFAAVEQGEAAFGVLPFENSKAGDVSAVLDLCFAHKGLYVSDVYDLPIRQDLVGLPGAKLGDVRLVVSHEQALRQSARFLQSLGVATRAYSNTAEAAKYVAAQNDASVAAVASADTAALYGLEILAQGINTSADNATRFIVVGKERPARGDRFSLLFTVDHKAGALARVIRLIGEAGYNLESIKSRPMPGAPWEYYFYAELVGDVNDARSKALLQSLDTVCRTVRLLGVYTRREGGDSQ